jgi:hypothetical protein
MSDKIISVAWRQRPFDGAFHHIQVAPGPSILAILDPQRDLPAGFLDVGAVRLNGDVIPREWWSRIRPHGGTALSLHVPIGNPGGSGGGGKNSVALVAAIAVLLAAAAVSGGAAGFALTAGGFGAAGALLAGGSVGAAVAAAGIGLTGPLLITSKPLERAQ